MVIREPLRDPPDHRAVHGRLAKASKRATVRGMKPTEEVARCMNLLAAMERALKGASIPIIITDNALKAPGPRIVFANRAFCASTGYSEKELLGQSPRMLQGARTDPQVIKRLAEHLKNGKPFTGETVNYRKDGTAYLASWNISPICDDRSRITHYVSFQMHAPVPRH
jgi:PAS domain S-box-containing protein